MFIKYDELDLMELFWSEGKSMTGNIDDGEVLYRRDIDNFKLTLFLYTYEMKCNIFLSHKEENIVSIDLNNITELKKNEEQLCFFNHEKLELSIKFDKVFSIQIQDD